MKKVKVDREMLADKLKKALKFVPSKSIVPAQDHFRLTVTDGVMEIMAADSQCQVKVFCPVKSTDNVAFCLPAKLFYGTIDKFRENDVVISITDKKIELKNGKSKYNLPIDCLAEDWPIMPNEDNIAESEISILQYNLKLGIKYAERFIKEEQSVKVNANGINIDEIDSQIIFTGLDGHNACRVNTSPLAIGTWHKSFVLPEESANKISSLLNENGEICMCHNGNKAVFFTSDDIDKFEVMTLSVNTKYPNSEGLFNKMGEDFMVVNTSEFKDAVLRLKMYASIADSDKRVIVKVNPENTNELILNSVDTMTGKDGEERMTVTNGPGKQVTKGFNSTSILNVLNCIDENDFMMFYNESNKVPIFIQPMVDADKNNFKFIVGTTSTD